MNHKPLLIGLSRTKLVDFKYHINEDSRESYIEIFAIGDNTRLLMRFMEPTQLKIDEGFSGSLSGMEVLDVSHNQWDRINIQVQNIEQDPGISFYARELIRLDEIEVT